jgi:transcription elongation factor Elf1
MAQRFTVHYTFECPHCKHPNEGSINVLAANQIEARNKIYPVDCSKCGKPCPTDPGL